MRLALAKDTKNVKYIDYSKLKVPSGYVFEREGKILYNLLENSNRNILLTGRAGCGKSTLIKIFRDNTRKNVVVVAPTGIAALNAHGTTIHSFFKFPIQVLFENALEHVRGVKNADKIDILIIDEISMVRADILDAMDIILRRNGKDPSKPFGGTQIVAVGDLYQIPPVVTDAEKVAFSSRWKSPYFFSSKVFKEADFKFIELQKVHRQKDLEFLKLLEKVRMNDMDFSDYDTLNEYYGKPRGKERFITLTSLKKTAFEINKQKLDTLPGNVYSYPAQITGMFNVKHCRADELLELKVGAQVCFIRNDQQRRWLNGTLGIVRRLRDDFVEVEVEDPYTGSPETYEITKEVWENVKYEFNHSKDRYEPVTVGSFEQYPIKLNWASTIHSSQGCTFDKVDIDLAGTFANGQTYVALSRCTTLEGIRLRTRIKPEHIIVDPIIGKFFRYIEKKKLKEETV